MINLGTETRVLLARERQEQLRRAYEPRARASVVAEPRAEERRVRLLGWSRRRARLAAAQ